MLLTITLDIGQLTKGGMFRCLSEIVSFIEIDNNLKFVSFSVTGDEVAAAPKVRKPRGPNKPKDNTPTIEPEHDAPGNADMPGFLKRT